MVGCTLIFNHCHLVGSFKVLIKKLAFSAALEYLISHLHGTLNTAEFEAACGIGVKITAEDIERAVEKQINLHKEELIEKRFAYRLSLTQYLFCHQILFSFQSPAVTIIISYPFSHHVGIGSTISH